MGEQRRRSRQEDAVSSQGQVKARGQSESSPGNVQRCHHRSAAGPDGLRAQEDLNAENGEKKNSGAPQSLLVSAQNAAGQPQALGLVDGNAGQVLNQVIGCAIAWGLAIVGSLVILKICDVVVGLRVSKDDETQGLDLSQHGEEGYILEA